MTWNIKVADLSMKKKKNTQTYRYAHNNNIKFLIVVINNKMCFTILYFMNDDVFIMNLMMCCIGEEFVTYANVTSVLSLQLVSFFFDNRKCFEITTYRIPPVARE